MFRFAVILGLLLIGVPQPSRAQSLDTVLANLFGVRPAPSRWQGIERYAPARHRQHRHLRHSEGVNYGAPLGGQRIMATYYGGGERLSTHTASGERFIRGGHTAAHRTLPFGTRLQVVNPRTGRSVIVRINDRGPFRSGYSLDLAAGAARAIGFTSGPLHIHRI